MSQADFFAGAECELAPRARRGDPATSHGAAAAATSLSGDHHMLILASLQRGAAGADGIAARCRLSGHQVLKRMAELERMGLVRLTGREVLSAAGRPEREWIAA